jgi:hypothetical protein
VIDIVNLKIKSTQFFRDVYMSSVYVYMFIGVNIRSCMSIYVYIMFLKNNQFDETPRAIENFG